MSVVDISQGFAHYSPQELINYANNGENDASFN